MSAKLETPPELLELLDITLQEFRSAMIPLQRQNYLHFYQDYVYKHRELYISNYKKYLAYSFQELLVITMNLRREEFKGFLLQEALLHFDALQYILDSDTLQTT